MGSSHLSHAPPRFPKDRCLTLDQHQPFPGLWKTLYKLLGYAHPRWLNRLKANAPGLIHAHFGLDGVLALPLAKRLKLPLIVTFHGYYATTQPDAASNIHSPLHWFDYINKRGQFFRYLYFRKQATLFKQSNCIIAVSQHIKHALVQKGCPPEKIQVHYIGVDVEQFKPDKNSQRQSYVLFVGRLVEKKGCEYLIQAMAQVQKACPEAELVVIGDGPLQASLETSAAQTLTRYRFEGRQPPHVVKDWMGRSCTLVAPSITTLQGETEGLPIVILEAMAMGLPVVSSIHAGIPEAIIDGETGFLRPERDVEGIAIAVQQLLQDAAVWQRFSKAGRQRVEETFNLQANTRKLEQLYDKVLAKDTKTE
ncbi:MAG: glycosyltransferase [Leptolyngbyaceae cyanobacterium]